jgi:hypothetical protein
MDKRTEKVSASLSVREYRRLQLAAEWDRQSVSAYVRDLILRDAVETFALGPPDGWTQEHGWLGPETASEVASGG